MVVGDGFADAHPFAPFGCRITDFALETPMKRILFVLCLVLLAWPVQAQEAATLSNLEIALWPEYDRAEVLVIASGLAAYGHTDLAASIADKTVANAIRNGISEHYDSVSGKPLGVPDYCMSSTLVTMMLDGLTRDHTLTLRRGPAIASTKTAPRRRSWLRPGRRPAARPWPS